MASDVVTLEVDGREVRVTNPGKVFFSTRGETKFDLVEYYLSVAEPLMRAMGGRPVLLERYPDGAGGKSFFQKRVPKSAPEWLTTTVVSTPNGTLSNAMVAADLAHVVWAVNMGCLGFHVWPYRADTPDPEAEQTGGPIRLIRARPWPERPVSAANKSGGDDAAPRRALTDSRSLAADELRIDLDPQPGVAFDQVREAAREVKAAFDELAMAVYIKTSGRRGLHVYSRLAPRWDSYDVRAAAVAMAREMAPAPARPDHRRLVEGGAGPAGVRGLQPERPPQDGVRGLVGSPPHRRPGIGTDQLGRTGRRAARGPDHRQCRRPGG